MTDLEPLRAAFRLIGEDPSRVLGPGTAHLVAYGHELVSRRDVPGLTMDVASAADGVRVRIQIEAGALFPGDSRSLQTARLIAIGPFMLRWKC